LITRGKPVLSGASVAVTMPATGRWQALKSKLASRREAYFFASPALFIIVVFVIFPLVYSFYLTFQNYDLAIGPPAEYVGVENYQEMLLDTRFWRAWVNTCIIIFPAI